MEGYIYYSNKGNSKRNGYIAQVKHVSADITVENLVSYGRYPHLKFGKRLDKNHKEIITWAIEKQD